MALAAKCRDYTYYVTGPLLHCTVQCFLDGVSAQGVLGDKIIVIDCILTAGADDGPLG